jgi:hypothetical protein
MGAPLPFVIAGPRRPGGSADFRTTGSAASVAAAAAEADPIPCTPPNALPPIAAGAVVAKAVLLAPAAIPLALTRRTSSPFMPKLAGAAWS